MKRAATIILPLVAGALAFAAAGSSRAAPAQAPHTVEVVVGLAAPPLARAVLAPRSPAAHAGSHARLNLRSLAAASYLRRLDTAQRSLESRITAAIPAARVRWRYRVVADGLAVVLPASELPRLARLPGVATVYPSVTYRALMDKSPAMIGAPSLWGPTLATAGQGLKIGIIDDGVDQTHPFLDPAGLGYPPGFPKGDTGYTTPKVIAARAFPPPNASWRYASVPFDPQQSEHATHVAGIAAGDHGTVAQSQPGAPSLSGIAPDAYIGNYKVLTMPTDSGVGLDGNSPEIVAGIEAAVQDGMDVINLSLGEPEIPAERDLVVQAMDAAADAGVVPVVAAGNDFSDFGYGSISSPGTADKAITVAAVTTSRGNQPDLIASFSSGGPTAFTLQLKPDVSAPGVEVLSSVPKADGLWQEFSGTSMAAPQVAGAAAVLRQRHPAWTVAQIKSALVLTGDPVYGDSAHTVEMPTTREGGGLIDLVKADAPLVFSDPTSLSFGLLRPGSTQTCSLSLADAGGGTGPWSVTAITQHATPGVTFTVPATVSVPGVLPVTVSVDPTAAEGDVTGFVTLQLGDQSRRVPFWLRVTRPQLPSESATSLDKAGVYSGTTAGKPARVARYRYPEDPPILDQAPLSGPEQVFRVKLARPAANFGVVVLTRARGVRVTPRVLIGQDENRLAGYPGLPIDLNPWRDTLLDPAPVAGAIAPSAGTYSIVFDTPARTVPGAFTFRFWLNDTTPPAVRLLAPAVAAGGTIQLKVTDAGSGVDPHSLEAAVDGKSRDVSFAAATGIAAIDTAGLAAGPHSVRLRASDYQEAKNMENVGPILPNTRTFTGTIRIRG